MFRPILQTAHPHSIIVWEDQHILDLFPVFYQKGVHHLAVVDFKGQLVGMLTANNLLAALHADMLAAS